MNGETLQRAAVQPVQPVQPAGGVWGAGDTGGGTGNTHAVRGATRLQPTRGFQIVQGADASKGLKGSEWNRI